MRISQQLVPLLLAAAGAAQAAASSWGFDAGSVHVVSKKGGPGDGLTHKLGSQTPLASAVVLGNSDVAKVSLTTTDGGKAKRPHQAFLLLKDRDTGVEAPFPLGVKENGKASVKITHKELPVQLLASSQPLAASVVLGSFGSSDGFIAPLFDLEFTFDAAASPTAYERPLRYGARPEIHHIFGEDPSSPPKAISLFFAAAVVATLPALFIGWLVLGANLNQLPKALGRAPISHPVFFSSIVLVEGVFFLYYSTWNLFQTLPALIAVGAVTVLGGSKALNEVRGRRLAGER